MLKDYAYIHVNCYRQNNPSKDVYTLTLRTRDYAILHGERNFADVINIIDLQIGRLLDYPGEHNLII